MSPDIYYMDIYIYKTMDMDNDYGFIFQDINKYNLGKFNHDLTVLPHWNHG